MFISGCRFPYSPPGLPPQFFDDLGGANEKVSSYYKQYAWIQPGDPYSRVIGKIALACFTLTASLWISMALDCHAERQKSKSKLQGLFHRTVVDLFRHTMKMDGKDLYQIGWERVKKGSIHSKNAEVQRHIKHMRTIQNFDLREADNPEHQEARATCRSAIEACVKEKVLPELFNNLKARYGSLRALQVHDALCQTLSNKMGEHLYVTFFNELKEDFKDLHYNCDWGDARGSVPSEEININLCKTLSLYQNYRFYSIDGGKQITKIRIELKLTVDIGSFASNLEAVFYPCHTITAKEAQRMNQVWESFSFHMPLPT